MNDNNLDAFLKKMDFMKLGRAISEENWQIAMMTVTRLGNEAKKEEIDIFDKYFAQIRQCIIAKNKIQGLNVMSLITAKRVSLINNYKSLAEK